MFKKKSLIISILSAAFILLSGCPTPLAPANLSILQDLIPPEIIILTPAEGSQFRSSVTVSGKITDLDSEGTERTASAGKIIKSFDYLIQNQDTGSTSITPADDGTFIFTLDTKDFSKQITIQITAADLNGNIARKEISLLPYTEGPSIELTSPADYSNYATILYISGTVSSSEADSGTSEVAALSYRIPGTNLSGSIEFNSADGSFSASIDVSSIDGNKVIEVTAVDLCGNITSVARTITKPAGGGDISGLSAVPGNKQVALFWEAVPDAEFYSIFESSFGQKIENITSPNYTWTGLDNGEIYSFQITAHMPESLGTDAVSKTITKMPLSPRSFTPRVKATGDRSISLEWQANENVSNYILERSLSAAGPWETIRTLPQNYYKDEDLSYGQIYYYRVTPSNFQDIISDTMNTTPGRFGFNPLSSCDTPSEAYKVALDDNYVYVADDSGGLQIIDISDKSSPALMGTFATPGSAWGVAVSGDYAYVVGGYNNLQVVDISNRASPQLHTPYQTEGGSNSITIQGGAAFITSYKKLLKIDITKDPPEEIRTWTLAFDPTSVAIKNDYAYVTSDSGYYIINHTTAASPAFDSSINSFTGVTISGNFLYISANKKGLYILDITDPVNPTDMVLCDTPGIACGVAVSGNFAYIADGSSGIQVVDISDPAVPKIVDNYDTPGFARGVAVSGNYVYAADATSGIQIFDVYKPPSPVIASSFTSRNNAHDVAVSGNYACLAYHNPGTTISGVQIIDISNPLVPTAAGIESYHDITGYTYALDVSAGCAYLAGGSSGLQAIDISNPENPGFRGSCDTSVWLSEDICIFGSYVYNSSYSFGLLTIDISDPSAPIIVNNCNFSDNGRSVVTKGGYAYVADGDAGILIIDITNPENPMKIGQCTIASGAPNDITVDENYAYITTAAQSGLQIVDISNPASPVERGFCAIGGTASAVDVSGNYAYVACGVSGIEIINLTNPDEPFISSSCDTSGRAQEISVRGSYVYVADLDGGLQIINLLGE